MKVWYCQLLKDLRNPEYKAPEFLDGRSKDDLAVPFDWAKKFKVLADDNILSNDNIIDKTDSPTNTMSNDNEPMDAEAVVGTGRTMRSKKMKRKRDQRKAKKVRICPYCHQDKNSDRYRQFHLGFNRKDPIKCKI